VSDQSSDRMRVVIYYAVWAIACAAVAGIVVALIHTLFFSYHPGRSGLLYTLFGDAVTALGIAAGQGAVALLIGSILAGLGRSLGRTVLLGLLIGTFDFLMYVLQMTVPRTELGWPADVAILVTATVLITLYGAATAPASAA